jgi:hypothetical protein
MESIDMFVGIPRYAERGSKIQIVINESEIHPTTIFCNKMVADEMARLWIAGYKVGNYKVVPDDFMSRSSLSAATASAEHQLPQATGTAV